MRLVFSDEVLFKSALGGHHVSLGKPKACTAKQPSEVWPVYTTNLCFLRIRGGDHGRGVNGGQRDSQLDVNQVYYVFGHLRYLAML